MEILFQEKDEPWINKDAQVAVEGCVFALDGASFLVIWNIIMRLGGQNCLKRINGHASKGGFDLNGFIQRLCQSFSP